MIRKVLLAGIILLMLAVMVITWGSMGSGIIAYCLLMLTAALLYQRFVTNRAESDYQMEE